VVFSLKHVETKKYLSSKAGAVFTKANCGQNCPIEHQLEVCATPNLSIQAKWRVVGGLFYTKRPEDYEYQIEEDENLCGGGDSEHCEGGKHVDEDGYEEIKNFKREDL